MGRDRLRPAAYLLVVGAAAAAIWLLSPEEGRRAEERAPAPATRPAGPTEPRLVAPESRPRGEEATPSPR